MKSPLKTLMFSNLVLVSHFCHAWTPGDPGASRGLAVDTSNRNEVLAFWQAGYKPSSGYEERPMWKEHSTPTFYAPDYNVPYSYQYNAAVEAPAMMKGNGIHAGGELHLGFVKDVERRINYYRAMAGVPADVKLMDSDTQKSSATIRLAGQPAYEPAASTTKASAAQKSAYMMHRTYVNRYRSGYHTWGMYHNQSVQIINQLVGWNREVWNANRFSNLATGFYGPGAIDKYMSEEIAGQDAVENTTVGHRRNILALLATNFATGDIPGSYTPGNDGAGNPQIKPATNALYVLQRNDENATGVPARFTSYPAKGYFPANLNTPYWSVTHPNAAFTTESTITITGPEGNVAIGTKQVPAAGAFTWVVNNAQATSTQPGEDRTYQVTIGNFLLNGAPASYSYQVTFINPEKMTSPQILTGTNEPPAGSSATYFFQTPPEGEAVQVNVFKANPSTWTETATAPSGTIVNDTHPSYAFLSNILPVSGGNAFRLTHAVRYDPIVNGVPEESFELNREILAAPNGNSRLKFVARRGLMTPSSVLTYEASSDEGATWTSLGAIGGTPAQNVDSYTIPIDVAIPASSTPWRIRFRFHRLPGDGGTYNHQDLPNNATGIFIDNISTTNTADLELLRTNEMDPSKDRITLNNITAGGPLVAGETLHLRMRTKLGGHWYQYAPSKVVTPTGNPLPGFSGWTSYDYPILNGGFAGDHDGDGQANGVSFAFYKDPLTADNSSDIIRVGTPSTARGARSSNAATFSIRREVPALRTGITYGAEWSDTLGQGSWSNDGVEITFDGDHVIATAPAGPTNRFLRWRIRQSE